VILYNFIGEAPLISLFINIFIKDFNVININLYRNITKLIEFRVILSNRINNRVRFIYNGVLFILIRLFFFSFSLVLIVCYN